MEKICFCDVLFCAVRNRQRGNPPVRFGITTLGIQRKERGKLRYDEPIDGDDDMTNADQPDATHNANILRSRVKTSSSVPRRRSNYVLLEECIICQKIKQL